MNRPMPYSRPDHEWGDDYEDEPDKCVICGKLHLDQCECEPDYEAMLYRNEPYDWEP